LAEGIKFGEMIPHMIFEAEEKVKTVNWIKLVGNTVSFKHDISDQLQKRLSARQSNLPVKGPLLQLRDLERKKNMQLLRQFELCFNRLDHWDNNPFSQSSPAKKLRLEGRKRQTGVHSDCGQPSADDRFGSLNYEDKVRRKSCQGKCCKLKKAHK
jgi:hypothetical protein